ncbi:MAG: hypothetical protein L0H64_17070 [Pseudonocardia sp.]|nr:hypothetical protein [Pseudonocardia sp.]
MTTIDMSKGAPAAGDDDRPSQAAETPPGGGSPTPVAPRATPPAAGDEREPILVEWLRDRRLLVDTARRFTRRNSHRALRHLVWLPVYLARLIGWSPRGLWRVLGALVRALTDEESRGLQRGHAGAGESREFVTVERVRKDRVHNRLIVVGTLLLPPALYVVGAVSPAALGAVVGVFVGVLIARSSSGIYSVLAALAAPVAGWWLLPPVLPVLALPPAWATWVGGVVAVLVLGWHGRPEGKRVLAAEKLVAGAPAPISAPMVREALCNLGLPAMKDPAAIGLLFDVARTTGGYSVGLELPAGVTATSVISRREALSAALRRELGTVWPTRGRRHEGHLELYVADENVATAKQRPWALMEKGTVNVFDAVPLVTDQRGKWVPVRLAYTSGVIGGLPRMGKTFVMRQLGLVFALDPRTRIYAFDLKGTGDFGPLSLVAHGYGVGDEPEDIDAQLVQLRDLHGEMRRRVRAIRRLAETDRELCPENKTNDLIASRRDLGLEPILLLVDECQIWFEHPDKAKDGLREEFIRICTDLVKRGPAVGVHCYFGTQKPDAASIPTPISANAAIRFCMKVMGQPANDAILGTGAYKAGLNATVFAYEDKGLGYLRGEGSEAQIVRSVHGLDGVAAEKIALRARAVRSAQNRLAGYAAGEDMPEVLAEISFLDDCRQVVGDADGVHLVDLAAALGKLRGETYGTLNARSVGAMLREAGIEPRNVWVGAKGREQANGQGVTRVQLHVPATDPNGDADSSAS